MNFRQKKKRDSQTPDLFAESLTSYRDSVSEFVLTWNQQMFFQKLPPTDCQCALIRNALSRPFFDSRWRAGISRAAKSSFLMMKMRPSFRLEWFCDIENFSKLVEGFYDREKQTNKSTIQSDIKTKRIGDDEEIV